jgi:hypothetical protein
MVGILPDSLWVEREKFAFDIEIDYENPPYFCFTCNSIGHSSDHCKKDPANKIVREMVSTKNDPVRKNIKHFVQKRQVDIVENYGNLVADVDPIILDIIRSKEVEASVLTGDVLNIEEELPHNFSVGEDLVQIQVEDVFEIPHLQDPLSLCGLTSSNVVVSNDILNPNVAYDIEILQKYLKGNDVGDIGHRVYTYEEENATTINFLNNRSAASEKPFTEVVSKSKKKNMQKGFQVHNTRSRGRHPG